MDLRNQKFSKFQDEKTKWQVPQIRGVFQKIFMVLIRNGHFCCFPLGRGAASLENFTNHDDCILIVLRVGNTSKTCSRRLPH